MVDSKENHKLGLGVNIFVLDWYSSFKFSCYTVISIGYLVFPLVPVHLLTKDVFNFYLLQEMLTIQKNVQL